MKVKIENKIYTCDNCGNPLEWETQIIMDNDDAFCSQKCSNEYYKDLAKECKEKQRFRESIVIMPLNEDEMEE